MTIVRVYLSVCLCISNDHTRLHCFCFAISAIQQENTSSGSMGPQPRTRVFSMGQQSRSSVLTSCWGPMSPLNHQHNSSSNGGAFSSHNPNAMSTSVDSGQGDNGMNYENHSEGVNKKDKHSLQSPIV